MIPTHNYMLLVLIAIALSSCSSSKEQELFNGNDLSGWHIDVPMHDSIPEAINPFVIRNGNLVSLGEPQGHLISDTSYENYKLTLQYRFVSKPGNCGILVHASEPRALYKMFPKSIEVQLMHENAGDFWCIVEDINVDNMEERRGPKTEWGITEGKLRRIKNLTDTSEKPLGEWNSLTVECIENTVKVWINNDLVNYGYDATVSSGQIAIQAEGSEVEFTKIRLEKLGSE